MDKYIDIIKSRMSEKRFIHSINVSKSAVLLAEKYGADVYKAELAGILHDCCKEITTDEMLQIITDSGIILTATENSSTKLWHSIAGGCYVKDVLNIKDDDVVNSILYHTTGRANMSLLEKIIFVADYISDERSYNGVDVMREKAFVDLDDAIIYALQFTLADLSSRKLPIHPNAVLCYNDVLNNLNKKELL